MNESPVIQDAAAPVSVPTPEKPTTAAWLARLMAIKENDVTLRPLLSLVIDAWEFLTDGEPSARHSVRAGETGDAEAWQKAFVAVNARIHATIKALHPACVRAPGSYLCPFCWHHTAVFAAGNFLHTLAVTDARSVTGREQVAAAYTLFHTAFEHVLLNQRDQVQQ